MLLHVLQIEADLGHAQTTALTLARHGIFSDHACNGRDGLAMLESFRYAVVLLELSLPDLDGIKVIEYIRTQCAPVSIITVSGRATVSDKVNALNFGSDDYITKPFDIEELVARMYAVLRRHKYPSDSFLTTGDIRLDPITGEVWISNQPVNFLPKERIILNLLMGQLEGLVSESEISVKLFGPENKPQSNIVKVHVYRMRQKFKKAGSRCRLESVYGLGYRLRA